MEVSLPPELEAYVSHQIASGRFKSPNQVFEAALRLLEDQEEDRNERIDAFNGELRQRLDSLDRGEFVSPASARERIRHKSDQRKSIHA